MSYDRAKNYRKENFDALFNQYDEDKNGFIEKVEMANFIKIQFKEKPDEKVDLNLYDEFSRMQKNRTKTYTKLLNEMKKNFSQNNESDKKTLKKIEAALQVVNEKYGNALVKADKEDEDHEFTADMKKKDQTVDDVQLHFLVKEIEKLKEWQKGKDKEIENLKFKNQLLQDQLKETDKLME